MELSKKMCTLCCCDCGYKNIMLQAHTYQKLGILPPHWNYGIFLVSIWGGLDPIGCNCKSCSCFPLFTEKLLVIVVTILKDPFI